MIHPVREITIFLFCLFLTGTAGAQDNPFFGGTGDTEPVQPGGSRSGVSTGGAGEGAGGGGPGGRSAERGPRIPRGRFFRAISAVQRNLNESINAFALRIKKGEGLGAAAALLALSLVYGLIHALGPGHRKIILTSYFLQAEVTPLSGIGTAFGIAMVHGVSALILMSVLYFLLHVTISQTFNTAYVLMERISYGIIVALGIYLIVRALLEARERRTAEDEEAAGISSAAKQTASMQRRSENAAFIISSGIVPCPGASLILIFLFAQRLYAVGIFSVFAMSLGMGITLAAVAASVLFAKEKGLKRILDRHGKGAKVLAGIEIGGSVLVLLFGAVLLVGAL